MEVSLHIVKITGTVLIFWQKFREINVFTACTEIAKVDLTKFLSVVEMNSVFYSGVKITEFYCHLSMFRKNSVKVTFY